MWLTDVLVLFIHSLIFFFLIKYLSERVRKNPLGNYFLPGIIIKILAGIGLGLIYKYHYSASDSWAFYRDSFVLSKLAFSDPLAYLSSLITNEYSTEVSNQLNYLHQSRAFFMVKILSLFSIISYNNYWIASVYFSIFSFCGFWYLGSKITGTFPQAKRAVIISLLFWPSVLFWTSGILKESLVMGSICFCLAFALPFFTRAHRVESYFKLLIPFMFYILLKLKYYYAGVLIPVLFSMFFVKWLKDKYSQKLTAGYVILIWVISFLTIGFLATLTHPNLRVNNFLDTLMKTHESIAAISDPEDMVDYVMKEDKLSTVIYNAPMALFYGIFGPIQPKLDHFFHNAIVLENWLLWIMVLVACFNIKTFFKSDHKVLILSILVYVAIMSILMSLSSPNYGTLSRYKVGFLPFFVFVVCLKNPLIDRLFSWIKIDKQKKINV